MIFKKKKKGGSYVVTWDSYASSSDDMIVMMTRPPRRRHLQALLSMRSLLFSTLYHASWLRPLRYKLVMMKVMSNMIMKMKVIVVMMNQLRMNYLTC